MSNNSNGNSSGEFFSVVFLIVSFVMPIYAIFKDIQAGKFAWAVIDFIVFPLGALRGLMYLFGFGG